MENYKNFVDSIKEFSFDILGFITPGAVALLYILFSIDESILLKFQNTSISETQYSLAFFLISYIFGYIAMGLSLIKIKMCINNYQFKIENMIYNSNLFKDTIIKYNNINPDLKDQSNIKTKELRTRIMSYIPEADNKIYGFRFRSDLCEHTLTILITFACIFLMTFACIFLKNYNSNDIIEAHLVKYDSMFFYFHCAVIISCLFLIPVRNRFYDITMRIPFSIFLSKKLT